MNQIEIVYSIVIGLILLVAGLLIGDYRNGYASKARSAVEQCQKSLPRDQACEAVITAKVKST